MDALDALLGRHTVSPAFMTEDGPSAAELARMLAAAVAAPDHGRLRPWRFLVVSGEARANLGALFARALELRQPDAPAQALEQERQRAFRAPVTVVVVAELQRDHPKIPEIEQIAAVAAATQNLLLAAHAMGFAAKWSTGKNAYDPEVAKGLGLAPEDRIIALVSIGRLAADAPVVPHADADAHAALWLGPGEERPLRR